MPSFASSLPAIFGCSNHCGAVATVELDPELRAVRQSSLFRADSQVESIANGGCIVLCLSCCGKEGLQCISGAAAGSGLRYNVCMYVFHTAAYLLRSRVRRVQVGVTWHMMVDAGRGRIRSPYVSMHIFFKFSQYRCIYIYIYIL